jgi:hypothetical protein
MLGYTEKGVDMLSYTTSRYNAFHLRSLRLFAQHGVKRFRLDPIWWVNWEAARQFFLNRGETGLPALAIIQPNVFHRNLQRTSELFYSLFSRLSSWYRRLVALVSPRAD